MPRKPSKERNEARPDECPVLESRSDNAGDAESVLVAERCEEVAKVAGEATASWRAAMAKELAKLKLYWRWLLLLRRGERGRDSARDI